MKTLDEVIKAIEVCRDSYVAGKIIKSDVLHYLKEYKVLKYILDEIKQYNPEIKNLVDEFVSKVEGAK